MREKSTRLATFKRPQNGESGEGSSWAMEALMRSLSRGVFIHTKAVLGDRAAKIGGNTVKRPTRFFLAGRFLIRMVIMMKQAKQVSDFINSTIGL